MVLTVEKERAREYCAARDRTIAEQQQQVLQLTMSSPTLNSTPINSDSSADDGYNPSRSNTKGRTNSEGSEPKVDNAELEALRLECTRQEELIKFHDEEMVVLKSHIDTLATERDQVSIESTKTVETFMSSMALLQQELDYLVGNHTLSTLIQP